MSKSMGVRPSRKDPLRQSIGRESHNRIKAEVIGELRKVQGVTNIRVNQTQISAEGKALGLNRPDIQFTYQGKQYHIEMDAAPTDRAIPHKNRILTNDPTIANVNLNLNNLPPALNAVEFNVDGKKIKIEGGITL